MINEFLTERFEERFSKQDYMNNLEQKMAVRLGDGSNAPLDEALWHSSLTEEQARH